jgi:hypothetical protein
MGLKRRAFIKKMIGGAGILSIASGAAAILTPSKDTKKLMPNILYSAGMSHSGQYFISAVSDQGKTLFKTPLPARAHDISLRPNSHELLVFARRPGHFVLILDASTGHIIQRIQSGDHRPLYGHGVFSRDGNTLYLTANNIEQKNSVIITLDANDHYRKISEFSSGGIGAHEIHLLSDDKTLVVANGGILTHPETGRSKLNLETMTPALSYINSDTGSLLSDYRLDKKYHQLSIRHLDVNADDTVCFAMQYQGSRRDRFPLVGFHHQGKALQLVTMPNETLGKMKNYCGSVCADQSGQSFAISSPRGNLITIWTAQGKFIDSIPLDDACGIAASSQDNAFYFSNGKGEIHQYQADKKQINLVASFASQRWDNHMLSRLS